MPNGRHALILGATLVAAFGPGVARAQEPEHTNHASVQFVDVAAARGLLGYRNENGQGSGIAAADFDNDGDVDLFVPEAAGRPYRLYVNTGEGEFIESAGQYGLGITRQGRAALWFDYDNDGDLDLVVASDDTREPTAFRLFRQDSGGLFTDVTAAAGLFQRAQFYIVPVWWGGFCAGDINNDGFLDLYSAQWDGPSHLFLNNGDGTFSDITESSGVNPDWAEFGVAPQRHQPVMMDFDGDGWLDIYVAVDFDPNELWINQKNNTFVNRAAAAGLANAMNDMGVTIGDYDNDGDFDLYITNIYTDGKYNMLYRNDSVPDTMRFTDVTAAMGVGNGGWGWGTTFLDMDRDGNLDLAATNGYFAGAWPGDTSRFFWNPNGGATSFIEEASCIGFNDGLWGSSLITADFDLDGDLDLLQVAMGSQTGSGALRLLDNRPGFPASENYWILVRPRIDGPNRFAIGAVVRVEARAGPDVRRMMRLITAGISYLGQEPAEAFFGLGPATEYDVTVEWPDGEVTVVAGTGVNRVIDVVRPAVIPPNVSVTSTGTTPTRARLAWIVEDEPGLAVTVQRRQGGGPWTPLAALVTDGAFTCAYEDEAITPGATYQYRLAFEIDGTPFQLGEIEVVIPPAELALTGPRPNPSRAALTVAFSLPGGDPATLALFDLGGRVLRTIDVGGLGAGTHSVDLASGLDLTPGVYWIRLTQGGRVLTRKAALVP
jgi:hypothetical protein